MQKKLVNLEKGTEELRVFLETTSPQTWIISSRVVPDSLQRKQQQQQQQSHQIELQPVEKEGIWSKIRNLTSSLADEITSFGKPNPSFQQQQQRPPPPVVVGQPTPNYQQYPIAISPIRQFNNNNNNNSVMNNNNPLPIQQQPTYRHQQHPIQHFQSISPYEYNYQTQNQFNNRRRTRNVNGSYSAEPQHNPPHSYYYFHYYPSTNERPITNRKVTFRDPKDNCYYIPGREEQIQSNYYSNGSSGGVADEQDVCNFINGYRTSVHPSQYHRSNFSNYSNYNYNYNNYSPIQ